MQQMSKSETWWVPTLQVLSIPAQAKRLLADDDFRFQYVPFFLKHMMWYPELKREIQSTVMIDKQTASQLLLEMAKTHVAFAKAQGVKIMAGTDTSDTGIVAGFSLHDELLTMVNAGISPLEALQSATINPAQFAGMAEDAGTVSVGKFADLVILDENPIEDIQNIRKISSVVFNGHHYRKDDLVRFRNFSKEQFRSIGANLTFAYNFFMSPLMRMQISGD